MSNSESPSHAEIIYLWPERGEQEDMAHHLEPIPEGVKRLTDVNKPALLVFEPEKSNNKDIGIIVSPGGAYQFLSMDLEGTEIAGWLNSLGITAFVLQYSVPENRPAALSDMFEAIKLVRRKYPDLKEVGLLGFSAGAHLSMRAIDNMQLDGIVDFGMLVYPAYLNEFSERTLTPEISLRDNMPPLFLVGAANDKDHFPSVMILADSLSKKKCLFEFHLFNEGGHGFGLRKGNPAAESWPLLAESWLKRNTSLSN